jgi:multidrug efflux pump subunit AcrB
VLGRLLGHTPISVVMFLVLMLATGWLFAKVPRGFLPQEDQSYFFVNIQLPDGARLARTDAVLSRAENLLWEMDGIRSLVAIGGRSLLSGTQQSNAASVIVILEDWDERRAGSRDPGLPAALHPRIGSLGRPGSARPGSGRDGAGPARRLHRRRRRCGSPGAGSGPDLLAVPLSRAAVLPRHRP